MQKIVLGILRKDVKSIFPEERCLGLAICGSPHSSDNIRNLGRAKEILDFLFSSKNHLTLSHCLVPPSYKEGESIVGIDGINLEVDGTASGEFQI